MNEKNSIPMSIPDIGQEEKELVLSTFENNWFSQGKLTSKFEENLGSYLSSSVTVVNNGSSALMAALLAIGIKPGDKIIVPDFTFIATSSIPKLLGAKIIPADIDKNTLNISLESIQKIVKESSDIKAVIFTDIGGLSNNLDALNDLSARHNFSLIEDAAEAFGAEFKSKKLGSFEHTTIFSFHIAKQLTTIEGGCVASTNSKIIQKIQQIRDHGRRKSGEYVHEILGSNFRTTDIQSAIGLGQLKKIDQYIENRNNISSFYKKNIKNFEFQMIPDYVTKHSDMLFFLISKNNEEKKIALNQLLKHGIDARESFYPIHKQPCNPEIHNFHCEISEQVYEKSFTIPIFNNMNLNDAENVVECLNEL